MRKLTPFMLVLGSCASDPALATSTTTTTAALAPGATSFEWAKPEQWKSETIPFPLGFAPDLPHVGTEELRFAPGFFDPDAPGYWSYAFLWFVEPGPAPFSAPILETQLVEYFAGLTRAVSRGKFEPDLERVVAQLGSDLGGTVRTIDAFKTRREVLLNVRATAGTCGDHRYLLVRASPKPLGDPMWSALDDVANGFHCSM